VPTTSIRSTSDDSGSRAAVGEAAALLGLSELPRTLPNGYRKDDLKALALVSRQYGPFSAGLFHAVDCDNYGQSEATGDEAPFENPVRIF
jgi:hypothetical protein